MFQILLKGLGLSKGQSLNSQIFLLLCVQLAAQLFVDLGNLEVLPQSCHAQHIVPDVNDLHQGIVPLRNNPHIAFLSSLAFALQPRAVGYSLFGSHCQFEVIVVHFDRAENDPHVYLGVGRQDPLFEVSGENIEDLGFSGNLVALFKFIVLELQVNKKCTAGAILQDHVQLLLLADLDGLEINGLVGELDASIGTLSMNLQAERFGLLLNSGSVLGDG